MKASQIYAKTMKFVWIKLGIGALIAGISLVLLAIVVGISLLANSGGLLLVLGLIWYILTYGVFRAVMHYMGYMIKAAHIAVVSEAVTTGVIPDNMVHVGKEMVKRRFAASCCLHGRCSVWADIDMWSCAGFRYELSMPRIESSRNICRLPICRHT